MTTSFDITLDSKNDVFFPNSEVNGSLQLFTTESFNITKITAWIIGRAGKYTMVTESDGNVITQFDAHSAKHEYMCERVILWQQSDAFNQNTVSNGLNKFPFKFVIPSNVPPSFIGKIKYYVKGMVEFGKRKNVVKYHGFSVFPIIDLKLDPKLKLPATITKKRIYQMCFSCAKKPLEVTVSLPKSGYVCGETIALKIDISNKTSMKIKSLDYGIHLKYSYTVDTKTEQLLGYIINTLKPTSTSVECSFVIPPLPPSYCDLKVLKIQYYVLVKVRTDAFCKRGPSTFIPITIGNVRILKDSSYDASTILKTAEYIEGAELCLIGEETFDESAATRKYKPEEFKPKYVYYSNLDSSKIFYISEYI